MCSSLKGHLRSRFIVLSDDRDPPLHQHMASEAALMKVANPTSVASDSKLDLSQMSRRWLHEHRSISQLNKIKLPLRCLLIQMLVSSESVPLLVLIHRHRLNKSRAAEVDAFPLGSGLFRLGPPPIVRPRGAKFGLQVNLRLGTLPSPITNPCPTLMQSRLRTLTMRICGTESWQIQLMPTIEASPLETLKLWRQLAQIQTLHETARPLHDGRNNLPSEITWSV